MEAVGKQTPFLLGWRIFRGEVFISGRVFFAPSAFDPLDRPFSSHDGFCGRLETQGDSIFLLETG